MKLIIQIPCFNEAETLPETIRALPDSIEGVDSIELLVIDDGSTDGTADIARSLNVHHVLELPVHQGLAKAFSAGLKYAVRSNADIVVNTDADNQYDAACIADLIGPVLHNRADLVVGSRPIDAIPHFSPTKKLLQKTGSRMVRFLTGLNIPDVTSGFRAYSYHAARRLRVFSEFTYTVETLIQASQSGFRIVSVPVQINPPARKSRLFRSNWYYIRRQTATMIRIWALYSPVKLFARSGYFFLGLGAVLFFRFIYYYLSSWPNPSGKVQSVVVSAVCILTGFFLVLIGVIADLIAVNRRLNEEILDNIDRFEDH
ncbi:glycosyltransferase family 2 protein [bacterium]|nr:glycosyltransferase family 2 protein [candidate division CSSED10-310 bacterium]